MLLTGLVYYWTNLCSESQRLLREAHRREVTFHISHAPKQRVLPDFFLYHITDNEQKQIKASVYEQLIPDLYISQQHGVSLTAHCKVSDATEMTH